VVCISQQLTWLPGGCREAPLHARGPSLPNLLHRLKCLNDNTGKSSEPCSRYTAGFHPSTETEMVGLQICSHTTTKVFFLVYHRCFYPSLHLQSISGSSSLLKSRILPVLSSLPQFYPSSMAITFHEDSAPFSALKHCSYMTANPPSYFSYAYDTFLVSLLNTANPTFLHLFFLLINLLFE